MELLHAEASPASCAVALEPDDGGAELRVTGDGAFRGRILFKHNAPLVLDQDDGAELTFRNDAYGHPVWELLFHGEAAPATVRLREIPPPPAPIPETAADLAEFQRAFAARASRFPDEPAAFAAWQQEYRQVAWTCLTGGGRPERVPTEPRWEPVFERDEFILERLTYRSREDRSPTALLALPRGSQQRPAPLLLALHGHETTWGQAVVEAFEPGHVDDFCHYFAARGFAVLQPPTLGHELQARDWTLFGEWLWDSLVGLDAVAEREEIDMQRVGVVGLSTGARLSALAAALDERIGAAVSAGIFCTVNHERWRFRIPPHCDCGSLRQIDALMEQCDIAAMIAPRPCQVQLGREDHVMYPGADPAKLQLEWNTGTMPVAEFDTAADECRRAYRLAGAAEAFDVHLHPGAHEVDNAAAYAWITAALGG